MTNKYGTEINSFPFEVEWANIREPYYDQGNESRGIKPKKEYRITLMIDFETATDEKKIEWLTFLDNILSTRSTHFGGGKAGQILQDALDARIIFQKRDSKTKYYLQASQKTDFTTISKGKEIYCQFPVACYSPSGEKYKQDLIPDIDFKQKTIASIKLLAKPSQKTGDLRIWLEFKECQLYEFTKFYKEVKADDVKTITGGDVKKIDLSMESDFKSDDDMDEEIPF